MPRVAPAILVAVQFPAAELLIQPPSIRTVAHLDVREPLRDDRDDRGIHSDASTCVRADELQFAFAPRDLLTDNADDEPRLRSDE